MGLKIEELGSVILATLAIQSKIKGLEERRRKQVTEVDNAGKKIADAVNDLQSSRYKRQEAEDRLEKAKSKVNETNERISELKKLFKDNISGVKSAEDNLSKYNDDVLAELEKKIEDAREAKQAEEAKVDVLSEDINATEQELAEKKQILNSEGFDLSWIDKTARPKTTVF